MKVSYKSYQPENDKRFIRDNESRGAKVREKRVLSRTDFGPKRIVKCYTCDYIYNRTKKKECIEHSKRHLEYLSE
jgi:hypothetical protein